MRKSIDNVNQKALSTASPKEARGEELMELVHTVMHQLRSAQYQALRNSEGLSELTHLESKVLGFFGRRPGSTQSDLAQHSGRDKAQLARMIKGLRDRGLLAAEADPQDRRHQHLRLTPAAEALMESLDAQGRTLGRQAVTGLSAAEQAQLLSLMRRVHDNLQAEGGDVA